MDDRAMIVGAVGMEEGLFLDHAACEAIAGEIVGEITAESVRSAARKLQLGEFAFAA